MRRVFTDEVLRDMVGSGEVVAEIEREWEQLLRDRHCLRQIFPKGNNKVLGMDGGCVRLGCNISKNRLFFSPMKIYLYMIFFF